MELTKDNIKEQLRIFLDVDLVEEPNDLINDYYCDSLDLVNLIDAIETEFNIEFPENKERSPEIRNVGKFINLCMEQKPLTKKQKPIKKGEIMEVHICRGALNPWDHLVVGNKGDGWYLYSNSRDRGLKPMNFCPFCGEELND